ncbi:Type I restriction-modification system methyltransferase subunit [Listeria fleischmannii subsp. coloradonensis]|nr:Type I restriction-modification system methyltransferase subunit [Listeria fleischmannii subsp. coloradonensis]
MIENGEIDTVIGMPANLFYGTSIPTTVIVLRKNRTKQDVLFIDASKDFIKGKNQNMLSEENIDKVISAYKNREDVEKFAHLASFEEIKENDYNLNIPRYVDTFEEEPPVDMAKIGKEMKTIRAEKAELDKSLYEAISSLQHKPEDEEWIKGALEVFDDDK